MAKVIPFDPDPRLRRRFGELKTAFAAEHLGFFILAVDTAGRTGNLSPEALEVMKRALELMLEAKEKFVEEFL